MTACAFTVIGTPAPQGSKTRWGSEDNPNTRPWRAAIAAAASDAWAGSALLTGTVVLEADFYFPRPRSHYRTGKHAGELKPGAPDAHATKPDLDKLLRAVGDALTGVVIADDSRIAYINAQKLYGAPARLELHLEEVA